MTDAVVLDPAQVRALSSVYLDEGVHRDRWALGRVAIDGAVIEAEASMTATFVSPTDAGGFHLTLFSALQMVSQLCVILLHHRAGYQRKEREVWMTDCSFSSRSAVRGRDGLRVRVEITRSRKVGERTLVNAAYRVSDGTGGAFEGTVKGVMA